MIGINEVARQIHEKTPSNTLVGRKARLSGNYRAYSFGGIRSAGGYRNGRLPTEVYTGNGGKPEGIPIELADAIIRIFDYCGYAGIDIDAAITQKHEFNKTRPYRHGGKKC